jgi:hypothetical protein
MDTSSYQGLLAFRHCTGNRSRGSGGFAPTRDHATVVIETLYRQCLTEA